MYYEATVAYDLYREILAHTGKRVLLLEALLTPYGACHPKPRNSQHSAVFKRASISMY